MGLTLAEITAEVREVNIAKGWRPAGGGPGENTWGDYIALLHSEVSEALEAYRDHRLADATADFGDGECSCAMSETSMNHCPVHGPEARIKPEGVGSELADVLIRLVDMADVFGFWIGEPGSTLADWDYRIRPGLVSFGDHLTWLHSLISIMWHARGAKLRASVPRSCGPFLMEALASTARHFGIDLEAEYRRKIEYNRTREWQHGGRTLADSVMVKISDRDRDRLNAIRKAMPTDPRGWWTGEEIDSFLETWESLELPEIVLTDGQGETVMLWCSDVRRAAEMIGVSDYVTSEVGFDLTRGEYVASIEPAEEKETKDA